MEELESYNQFASGILLEGTTLADIIALRENEAALRAKLQEFIDNQLQLPDGLVTLYYELLAETDQALASYPLEIAIGATVLEIEVSEAMRMISEEYQRLGLVSLSDFDRLPGITQEDLAGLETLIDHLNARQVGIETNIPIFDSLSPFGNYTLIDRLIRKYADILQEHTTDHDNDGNREIDYSVFRSLINGTEITSREADKAMSALLDQKPIPWKALHVSPVSNESLRSVLAAIHAIEQMFEIETDSLVRGKGYEEVFEAQILSIISSHRESRHRGFISNLALYIKHPSIPLELLPDEDLPLLEAPPKATELKQYLFSLSQWNQDIRNRVTDFLDTLEISKQLEDDFKSTLGYKLNGYSSYQQRILGLYETHFKKLDHALTTNTIVFDLSDLDEIEINGSTRFRV